MALRKKQQRWQLCSHESCMSLSVSTSWIYRSMRHWRMWRRSLRLHSLRPRALDWYNVHVCTYFVLVQYDDTQTCEHTSDHRLDPIFSSRLLDLPELLKQQFDIFLSFLAVRCERRCLAPNHSFIESVESTGTHQRNVKRQLAWMVGACEDIN